MKSTVEPLEGNKVKLSIEVDESEFDKAIDAAFRRIAREVRMPGFRPGKAPRRLLEARLGKDVGREEALREALPEYYTQAVRENEVDVIAGPEIEITAGQEEGPVQFDAVVEIRPQVDIAGYGGLRAEIPKPYASEEEIDAQIDRLRQQFAELGEVDRPARDGDHVTISISGSRDGGALPGLQADDYLYEVGAGSIADEVDENLRGAKPGDVLEFDAQPAEEDEEPVQFRILVKDVKEKVLPEVDDEWANDVSEFETVEELRADLGSRISNVRKVQAQMAVREKAALALVDLVEEDAPEPMVASELQQRLQDLAMRLSAQSISAEDYLAASGKTQESLVAELRELAVQAVKADLALRALADAEGVEDTDDDVEQEIQRLAERLNEKPARIRKEFERADQLQAVRSDIRKRKALDWLVDHVELVDEDGNPIEHEDLVLPDPAAADNDTDIESDTDNEIDNKIDSEISEEQDSEDSD